MTLTAYPIRALTAEELTRYEQDGVIMVKGLLDPNWLDLVEQGLDEALADASLMGRFVSRKTVGYQMDAFLWKRIDPLRDLIYYSPFARWAQALMGSQEVRFFYDQSFVKEPGTDAPTPWHQDLTFWPIEGTQICSFWVPLDTVNAESSGLHYVKGSHKWSNRFKAVTPDYNATMMNSNLEDVPDINAHPDIYDIVTWDMEPGDVLIFHPLTLHGSSGNNSRKQRRRALALRWLGDDVRYTPGNARMPIAYKHSSKVNGPISGAAFPRILPTHIPSEREARKNPEKIDIVTGVNAFVRNTLAAGWLMLKGGGARIKKQTW